MCSAATSLAGAQGISVQRGSLLLFLIFTLVALSSSAGDWHLLLSKLYMRSKEIIPSAEHRGAAARPPPALCCFVLVLCEGELLGNFSLEEAYQRSCLARVKPHKTKACSFVFFQFIPFTQSGGGRRKEGEKKESQVTYSKREHRKRVKHFKISYIQSASGKTSA